MKKYLWGLLVLAGLVGLLAVAGSVWSRPAPVESAAVQTARAQAEVSQLERNERQGQFMSDWLAATLTATTVIGLAIVVAVVAVGLGLTVQNSRHRRRLELARLSEEGMRLQPDPNGNYPVWFDRASFATLSPAPGHSPARRAWPAQPDYIAPPTMATPPESVDTSPLPAYLPLRTALTEARPDPARLELVLGRTADGYLSRAFGPETLHFAFVGATGSGKSAQQQSIFYQLALADPTAARVRFVFVDHEGRTSAPFKSAPHTLFVADDAASTALALEQLEYTMNERAPLADEELDELPIYAVMVEEFLDLKDELPKSDWQRLVRLAIRGRKSRIYLACSGQAFYASEEVKIIRGQLRTRSLFAVEDNGTANAFGVRDNRAVDALRAAGQAGRFLFRTPGGLVLAQAPHVKESEIAAYFNALAAPVRPRPTSPASTTNDQPRPTWPAAAQQHRPLALSAPARPSSEVYPASQPANQPTNQPAGQPNIFYMPAVQPTGDLQRAVAAWRAGHNSSRKLAAALGCGRERADKLISQARQLGLIAP